MDAQSLDQVFKTFCSTAEYTLKNPQRTSKEQYQRLESLARLVLNNGLGERADAQGHTPLQLMAMMSEQHKPFGSIVNQYDLADRNDFPRPKVAASPALATTSLATEEARER